MVSAISIDLPISSIHSEVVCFDKERYFIIIFQEENQQKSFSIDFVESHDTNYIENKLKESIETLIDTLEERCVAIEKSEQKNGFIFGDIVNTTAEGTIRFKKYKIVTMNKGNIITFNVIDETKEKIIGQIKNVIGMLTAIL